MVLFLIASFDSIKNNNSMKPPYEITTIILKLVAEISEKIGQINANYLDKPSPKLRKQNKIKTIHNSLKIEGNTLTESQITALVENKKVIGPQKDILEVLNAIELYNHLDTLNPYAEKSFFEGHRILMKGLIKNPGKYRKQDVGIVKGEEIKHIAPPYENIPYLMKDLFSYLQNDDELNLIKSCVFHYEVEFIHPFIDGNGRMGRLWQTLILKEKYPIFEYIPFETLISKSQSDYYEILAICDNQGKSTLFIEFLLDILNKSLENLIKESNRKLNQIERLEYFLQSTPEDFMRKDYLETFQNISSATASRDLLAGIKIGLLTKHGDKNKTKYRKTK